MRLLFEQLGKPDWVTVLKESSFTKPVERLQTIRGEGETAGEEKTCTYVKDWLTGAVSCKEFLRKNRDWIRANMKAVKFPAVAGPALALFVFLREHGVQMHDLFRLLACRSSFVCKVLDEEA